MTNDLPEGLFETDEQQRRREEGDVCRAYLDRVRSHETVELDCLEKALFAAWRSLIAAPTSENVAALDDLRAEFLLRMIRPPREGMDVALAEIERRGSVTAYPFFRPATIN